MTQQPQQPPVTPPAPSSGSHPSQPTIGELVARISENISGLVQGEINLAKAKGKQMAGAMGKGAAFLGAAGVLALYAFGMLLHSAAHGIGEALPLWVGYLIVTVVLLLIAAPLAFLGKKQLDAGKAYTPAPQEGIKQDVQTVKVAVTSGLEKGNKQ